MIDRSGGAPRHRKTNLFLNGIGSTRDVDSTLDTATAIDWAGVSLSNACRIQEDFLAVSGVTPPAPWGTQDTSAAGSPTLDYVDDADNGTFELTSDTQAEAQKLTLYWADQLMIDATKSHCSRRA